MLEAAPERAGELAVVRHDCTEQKGAENRVDTDELGGEGGKQHSEEHERDGTVGRVTPLGPLDQPRRGGTNQAKHHCDEAERQNRDRQRAFRGGLDDAHDERQQAPGRHIADGRAGERDGAKIAAGHREVRQDAREHGKGGDRHRDADKQREAREWHVGSRIAWIEEEGQRGAKHEGQHDAGM